MAKSETSNLRVQPIVDTLFSRTVDVLRQAILNGDFKPGDRLIDRELCEKTGVGRSSVREALRQLEAEYLIENIPNCGAVVTVVTPKTAQEIYQLRLAIEGLGIRLFTLNASDQMISELERSIDRYEVAMKDQNLGDILQSTADFFEILFRGAGSDLAAQFSKILRARMSYLRAVISHRQSDTQRDKYIFTFRDMIKMIKSRDPDAAVAACQRHIEHASSVALSMLSKSAN